MWVKILSNKKGDVKNQHLQLRKNNIKTQHFMLKQFFKLNIFKMIFLERRRQQQISFIFCFSLKFKIFGCVSETLSEK